MKSISKFLAYLKKIMQLNESESSTQLTCNQVFFKAFHSHKTSVQSLLVTPKAS